MTDSADISLDHMADIIAESCRILGATGCMREVTGHASARLPGVEEMLIRCRRPDDPGVSYSTADDVLRVDFYGQVADTEMFLQPGQMGAFSVPGEFSIHSEIYKARPDVGAVVHGHPRSSLLCGIYDLPLEPIFGAYDPGALELAVQGIPVFPKSVLISSPLLGEELANCLGDSHVCLLRGHGIVTVGRNIYEATVRAIRLETLCDIVLQGHSLGRSPLRLPDQESEEIMSFVARVSGSSSLARATWDHYSWMLRHPL